MEETEVPGRFSRYLFVPCQNGGSCINTSLLVRSVSFLQCINLDPLLIFMTTAV